jgi:glucose-1-phosphate thymidylyltransferase
MKAIILVAGYATRLYPLTMDKPKALLTINEKPIIDYIIDEVNTIDDVDGIYVVSNHKFIDHFDHWVKGVDSKKTVKIIDDGTMTEETRRGGIGDIQYAIDQEKIDDDIVIIAGDNFFTYKLKDYYSYYKKTNKDCVCGKRLDDVEQLKQFAVAVVDEDGKITDLEEKPKQPKSDIGVYATYFYQKETVPLFKQYLDAGNKPDAPGYFVQWLYQRKPVYVYEMQGDCYDIGTHKSYQDVQEIFKNRK